MSLINNLPKNIFSKYNKEMNKMVDYKIVGHVDSLYSEGTYIMLPLLKDIPDRDVNKYAIRVKKYKVDEKLWKEETWFKVNRDQGLLKYI